MEFHREIWTVKEQNMIVVGNKHTEGTRAQNVGTLIKSSILCSVSLQLANVTQMLGSLHPQKHGAALTQRQKEACGQSSDLESTKCYTIERLHILPRLDRMQT